MMSPLLVLLPCPALVLLLALLPTPPRLLTRAAAALLAAELALAAAALGPVVAAGVTLADPSAGCCGDATAAWFQLLTVLVAAAALSQAPGFFDRELAGPHPPTARDIRQWYGFAALFVVSMLVVCCADDLGLLWISIEATTLLSAPLVYYHRSRTALEATWKYLIICSVGIAFAFFGTAVLFAASQQSGALPQGSLSVTALRDHAGQLPVGLLRLGFVFTLLGYGTKAGLFPIHTWLPDAHSEAPAPGSALLSGALLNCALVGLLRTSSVLFAAGQARFVQVTLLPLAVATVVAAALMLLRQRDLKRLLAYSSMENVGLMATAIALGQGGAFALQALNHSLVKVALFLLAGNLLQTYGSKSLADMRGLLRHRPAAAVLLAVAVLAVAGTPPFGSFLAEWQILAAAADGGHWATAVWLCGGLAVAFIALAMPLAQIAWGDPPDGLREPSPRPPLAIPAVLVTVSLLLGVAMTPVLWAVAQGVGR